MTATTIDEATIDARNRVLAETLAAAKTRRDAIRHRRDAANTTEYMRTGEPQSRNLALERELEEADREVVRLEGMRADMNRAGSLMRRQLDCQTILAAVARAPGVMSEFVASSERVLAAAADLERAVERHVEVRREFDALQCRTALARQGLSSGPNMPSPWLFAGGDMEDLGRSMGAALGSGRPSDLRLAQKALSDMQRRWDRGRQERAGWASRLADFKRRVERKLASG